MPCKSKNLLVFGVKLINYLVLPTDVVDRSVQRKEYLTLVYEMLNFIIFYLCKLTN